LLEAQEQQIQHHLEDLRRGLAGDFGEMLRRELGEIRDVRNELRQLRALFLEGSRSLSAVWIGSGFPLKSRSREILFLTANQQSIINFRPTR
jgi:hypothetical protein